MKNRVVLEVATLVVVSQRCVVLVYSTFGKREMWVELAVEPRVSQRAKLAPSLRTRFFFVRLVKPGNFGVFLPLQTSIFPRDV